MVGALQHRMHGLQLCCQILHQPILPSLPPPRQVPTKTSGKSYQICGVINQIDDTTLEITELPIRKWTQVRWVWLRA